MVREPVREQRVGPRLPRPRRSLRNPHGLLPDRVSVDDLKDPGRRGQELVEMRKVKMGGDSLFRFFFFRVLLLPQLSRRSVSGVRWGEAPGPPPPPAVISKPNQCWP